MDNPPDTGDASMGGAVARLQGPNIPAKARPQGPRRGTDLGFMPLLQDELRTARHVPLLSRFGPHVALAICLIGLACAAGSYFSVDHWPLSGGNSSPSQIAAQQDRLSRGELSRTVQAMSRDLRALQESLAALRADQSHMEKSFLGYDSMNARLDAVMTETSAAIAGIADRIERLHRDPETKLAQINARLDRMERKLTYPFAAETDGSGPAPAGGSQRHAQAASEAPRPPLEATEGQRRPRLIRNWVVHDVYGGVALLESPRGTIEVAPGEILPGAGRVKSIERRGPGWIVITSQGVVDMARNNYLP
ncbi:MAG: hypothetical protein L0Y50_06210 [Beijerinckiaceae bacterium]|nr:hypothetical protein [Beijerinckiaceae bacterium]